MAMRAGRWTGLAMGLAGFLVAGMVSVNTAAASDKSEEARGQKIVTDKCGGCHAVGATGASPHKTAPPFRTLGQRYTIESLEEALGEGLVSGHPDMPEFVFEPEDVGAIMAI